MSEFGDIGYLPSTSAIESAYNTIEECQIAVFIIGKRYGTITENKYSVTHNEFRKAKGRNIPMIFFVEHDVLTLKKVYDLNQDSDSRSYPGMESPARVFELIQEINNSPNNNGILEFSKISEARDNLKKQIGHIFGNLLSTRYNPISNNVTDILTEIKTLRHELIKGREEEISKHLAVLRMILSDDFQFASIYRSILDEITYDIAGAISELIKHDKFSEYLISNNHEYNISDLNFSSFDEENYLLKSHFLGIDDSIGYVVITMDENIFVNQTANDILEEFHGNIMEETRLY